MATMTCTLNIWNKIQIVLLNHIFPCWISANSNETNSRILYIGGKRNVAIPDRGIEISIIMYWFHGWLLSSLIKSASNYPFIYFFQISILSSYLRVMYVSKSSYKKRERELERERERWRGRDGQIDRTHWCVP